MQRAPKSGHGPRGNDRRYACALCAIQRPDTVEGNIYFLRESRNCEYFTESATYTTWPWKAVASYFDVVVDGKINVDVYLNPKPVARNIAGYVAFGHGVQWR